MIRYLQVINLIFFQVIMILMRKWRVDVLLIYDANPKPADITGGLTSTIIRLSVGVTIMQGRVTSRKMNLPKNRIMNVSSVE